MSRQRDIIIVGGGAAGLVVASVAAQAGLDVVLINRDENMGGDCLHSGCVPSKTLLKSASVADIIGHAERWGIVASSPVVDMGRIRSRVQAVIDSIQPHDSRERFETLGCEVVTGNASFRSHDQVIVNDKAYFAKRIVIATGSLPFVPDIEGLNDIDYLTNETVFKLDSLPESMAILGGGPVGVEMAQAFARLGTRVSLIERESRLLPMMEARHSTVIEKQLKLDGIEIHTSASVNHIKKQGDDIRLDINDKQFIDCESMLVAVGRRPNIDGLELERAGIDYDVRGIKVDSRMRTSRREIYACGDVTGIMPLTHVAELQAGVVIANMIFKIPKRARYDVVPFVVYTSPELASVGVTTSQAVDDKHYEIHSFPVSSLDRAITEGEQTGEACILVRKGKVIGAHISGSRAGELIHEIALVMQCKLKLSAIVSMVHAYPSFSQLNKRVAGQYYSKRLFTNLTRKLVAVLWYVFR